MPPLIESAQKGLATRTSFDLKRGAHELPAFFVCFWDKGGIHLIELKNISKDFGSGEKAVHAVRDVSLSIGSGEIFGIIGFSGAGKSCARRARRSA